MTSAFYEGESKLLTQDAFEFLLDVGLKRAVRSQDYVTLIVVETSPEREGIDWAADGGTFLEVAQLFGKELRDTDLVGHAGEGTLGVVLWDADVDHSAAVVDRLVSRIDDYEFQAPLRVALGAACYPTHAVDVVSLKRQAMERSIVSWRGARRSSATTTEA